MMCRTNLFHDKASFRVCKRKEIAKEGKSLRKFLPLNEYPPLNLIFSLLYYYFIIYMYFTCITCCLREPNEFTCKLIITRLRMGKLLLNLFHDKASFRVCKRKEIAKEGKSLRKFLPLNEYPPLNLIFSLLYYYFIIYMYFTCITCCLREPNEFTCKLIITRLRMGKLLLENAELKFLLGYFYLILLTFVISRTFSEPSLRNRVFLKLRLRKSSKSSRFTNIMHALYLWILVLNFLLIAMCNPNMKNPGPSPQALQHFSVFYCNVQGLIPFGELGSENPMLNISKVHELNQLIFDQKPDIVIYNETWLKGSIHDSEVIPTDTYKVFRLDRSCYTHPPDPNNSRKFRTNGGGVLIAIRHSLDIESKEIPVKCEAEILSVELTDKNGKKSIISSFYRVGTLGADNHSSVSQHLHTIRRRRHVQNLTLVGDLNLPHTCWENSSSPLQVEQNFIDTFNDLSLKQLVTVPTHIKGNILDYILTDKPELVTNLFVDDKHCPCGSDHFPIFFKLGLNTKRKRPSKRKFLILRGPIGQGLMRSYP